MSPSRPHLSLVIPAFNEAGRLPGTLAAVVAFVREQVWPVEVLVVDNNSRDETRTLAEAAAAEHPFLRVLAEPVQGKGAAVRAGALAATGDYVFLADADLSMPLPEVRRFLPPLLDDFDVAIGSREVPGAVRYDEPFHRHLMGRVFNAWVRWVAVPGIQDTQCGFKCFTRDAARQLFAAQTLVDFTFDVEILFVARRRGLRIVEVPVPWTFRAQSRVRAGRDSLRMAAGVLRVRWNGWRGVYGPRGKRSA
jgi:glycosyltransferase involved in cell wall biosynthesis